MCSKQHNSLNTREHAHEMSFKALLNMISISSSQHNHRKTNTPAHWNNWWTSDEHKIKTSISKFLLTMNHLSSLSQSMHHSSSAQCGVYVCMWTEWKQTDNTAKGGHWGKVIRSLFLSVLSGAVLRNVFVLQHKLHWKSPINTEQACSDYYHQQRGL